MKRGFLCVVSTFLPMLLGVIAHAQELPDRYTKLRNAEAYILDEIRKGVEEERKKLPPKIDEFKSTSDLPQPWMYEPTLERRAREQQWAPTLQAEERAKKAKAGEYLPAEIKTRFYQQLAHDYRLREEAQAKFDWLRSINENLQGKFARLSAANPAERTMLEKEIANDVRRAERLACFILSCEWPAPAQSPASQRPQPSQTSAAPTGPPEPKLPQIPSERGALPSRPSADAGLLQEQEMIEARMKATAAELDPNAVISAAKEQFGTGRAAGGGVSLHRPARIEGLDPASVQRAVVENKTWSLILKDGRRIQMPDVQLDDLAVAIRSIYGPESQVTGKVVAADGPAVVVETGASRFGEMLWRISDLPKPPGATEKGKELSLPIPPAVGIMVMPEPSMQRITYYGPIANTPLGRTLWRADKVISWLFTGVDADTGKPVDVTKVNGLMTILEANARAGVANRQLAALQQNPNDPFADAWWRSDVYVWVTQNADLRYDAQRQAIVPRNVTVKLDVWSASPNGPSAAAQQLATTVNANLDAFANEFPEIADLRRVTTVVSLVRWLKANQIPADIEWAQQHQVNAADTPAKMAVLVVLPATEKGKPIFRSRVEKK